MKLEGISDIRGEILVETGLHVGAGDLEMRIGGVDRATMRDPRTAKPYVPGSSLKGKIRSLLEWRSGSVTAEPLGRKQLEASVGQPNEREVRAIVQLFGVSGDADFDEATALRIGPTRVSFHDARMVDDGPGSNLPAIEVKSENRIDRIRGVAENPRQTERIAAGVRLAFRVTVKRLEGDGDLVTTLLEGMRLLELDSLGGSGSRGYGKVSFKGLSLDGADIQDRFASIDPFRRDLVA